MRRTVLLNPGPVTLSDRVRRALTKEDQCHREPEFAELTLDIKRRLQQVYPAAAANFEALLLSGSGTCAVEAMLASLAPQETKTLVVANGVYGERMAAMLAAHGHPYEMLAFEWLAAIDLDAVERRLEADASITHVATVHHETTTGRLNDLDKLGAICRRLTIERSPSFKNCPNSNVFTSTNCLRSATPDSSISHRCRRSNRSTSGRCRK